MRNRKKRGVIFDLDGTLVDSKLDFAAMRRDLGFAPDAEILETIAAVGDNAERKRLEDIVHLHEFAGANNAVAFPGALDLLGMLAKNNISVAIFTRNSRATAEYTLKRVGFEISFIVAREDAPPKPDPAGLHLITCKWDIKAHEALFVGDYLYDLEAGRLAGIQTILFAPTPPDFKHDHTEIVSSLMGIEKYIGI